MNVTHRPIGPMDPLRAERLHRAMIDLALERDGLTKISTVDLALLKSATLEELTLAGLLVRRQEDAQPAVNGTRSFSMICDDRIVAGIYCFLHYAIPPARTPFERDYVVVSLTDTQHCWFLAAGCRENTPDDEE